MKNTPETTLKTVSQILSRDALLDAVMNEDDKDELVITVAEALMLDAENSSMSFDQAMQVADGIVNHAISG